MSENVYAEFCVTVHHCAQSSDTTHAALSYTGDNSQHSTQKILFHTILHTSMSAQILEVMYIALELDCSSIQDIRELGSERCKSVWFLSSASCTSFM